MVTASSQSANVARSCTADSGDGQRWQEASYAATRYRLSDVAWSGERFVAVGGLRDESAIVYSSDGNRWQRARDRAISKGLDAVVWNGERFVAVGYDGSIVHSRDGDRWELAKDHDHPAGVHFQAIASSGRRFVAVNYGTTRYSTDGDHWEAAANTATVDTLRDVAWGHGRFVAVGWNGTIVTSP